MASSSMSRRPSLPPMPDLSHLTAEERQIIESVLLRQREEEEKEQEILRSAAAIFVSRKRPTSLRTATRSFISDTSSLVPAFSRSFNSFIFDVARKTVRV